MELGLEGKSVLVSASSRGIGLRIARTLIAEGAKVGICARDPEATETAAAELRGLGGTVHAAAVDLADADAYRAWIEAAGEALGGIDGFVQNVSGGGGDEGESSWQRNFELDVLSAVRAVEYAAPWLEKSSVGSLTFIGTTAAVETFVRPQPYNAMKAAVITYAKQVGQVLGARGIRVNVVSPGPILFEGGSWDRIRQGMPEFYDQTVATHPFGRLGTPEEVANAVVFLASPAASWVSGVNLVVDGGYTKRVQF